MMLDTSTLSRTLRWFEEAVPQPSEKNLQTQVGVHFEEVAEMLDAIQPVGEQASKLFFQARSAMKELASFLKQSSGTMAIRHGDRIELLDALCDQIVTATGVGHMAGFPMIDAMDEVNASNWSKFVDGKPVFDANMKIQKGPSYFKASLDQYAL